VWIRWVLPPMEDLAAVKLMLEEQTIDWTRPIREEAARDGILQGEAIVMTRLLEKRFGPLTQSVREQIAEADAETLLEWADRFVDAQRLEDVLQ